MSTTDNLISYLSCVQAAGGYTTGSSSLVSLLRQRSRPYRCTLALYRVNTHRALLRSFSNSLPPPVVAAASQVFSLLMADPGLVGRIEENTKHFRKVDLGCFLV